MKKFLVLTRVQLRALLASVRVGGSRKKAVSGWLALALIAALCLYISGIYSFSLGGQLAQIGALDLLFLLMPGMAVIGGLMFTAIAAQGVVFGGRDGDLLLSMPVSAFAVLLSKLTALYVENLLICTFLILPAGAAWLRFSGAGGLPFIARLVIGILFLAMLPTVLALAAGFLLSWLGGRFANRKLINTLLYSLMMAAVMALAIQINLGISGGMAGSMGMALPGGTAVWSIPFRMFQCGVCGDWETLVMFCLFSLAPVLLAVGLFAKFYKQVLTGLRSHGRRSDYKLTRLSAAGHRMALLKKEASRYFGTPIYLFNTGLGLILLVIGGIAVAVMRGRFMAMLDQAGLGEMPLGLLAAATAVFLLSTVAVTGSSISLEGQNLWILKEAPVSAGEILAVKALFQVLLELPCLLVGTAGLAWGLGMPLADWGALMLFGAAFGLCTALLGLTVNLLLPKLDAVNDMVVVKQSAASMGATFGSMLLAIGCGLAVWGLSGLMGTAAAQAVCALGLLAGSGLLAWWLGTKGTARFWEL